MIELTIKMEGERTSTRSHPPMNPLQILAVCRHVEELIMHEAFRSLPNGTLVAVTGPQADAIVAQAKVVS